ncbi:MAG: TonB-dependent receptor [Sphingomonas paucimobilis]
MAIGRTLAGAAIAAMPLPAAAQEETDTRDEIVVTGKRPPGSAIGDIAPVAVLDAAALRALGATSMQQLAELLKPLTSSASGGEPVFLLNGRRISSQREIWTLPPEALERTEVLSEQDAARFGFSPTVRVVNFVLKRQFRALVVDQGAGTTTDGGGGSERLELGSIRIAGDRRTSLTINYDRQNPLRASQRPYLPDSDSPFDRTGNVRAADGGSIDAALDALAGRPVTTAAVPIDPARRGSLADYVAGTARATDLSPFLSLRSRDALKVDGTHAVPIGKTMTGSINLTMEADRGRALAGLQAATLALPAGSGLPFAGPVLLDRYLDEAPVLTQRNDNLTLHAGTTVQGGFGRWLWNVTGGYDRVRARAAVERGVAPGAVQAAVDAGADPFDLGPVAATEQMIVTRSRTVTGTLTGKATANGPVLQLPAGPAQLTLNADYARSGSSGRLADDAGAASDLTRTVQGGSASLDLPIASTDRGVLSAIGSLSANVLFGLTQVSDYGSLASSNVALNWTPKRPVQITASINTARTPPAIATLTQPIVTVPNTPFFDFVTGASAPIAVTGGGNTDLAPEERQIRTLGIGWRPIKDKQLNLGLSYIDTRITDQVANLVSATAALQAAFPDRFVRDDTGRLLRADIRPVNLFREVERKLKAEISFFGPLGSTPPPPAKDAPPPPERPQLWSFLTATARLSNRLTLRQGQGELDLLDGETLDGNSGRPRYEVMGNIGGSVGAVRMGAYGNWRPATRIRSTLPASDLRFSGLTFIGLYSQLQADKLAPRAPWAKRMVFQFEVQNLLNDRVDVRDRNDAVPYRFQPSFLDPYGRIVRLSVRKLF